MQKPWIKFSLVVALGFVFFGCAHSSKVAGPAHLHDTTEEEEKMIHNLPGPKPETTASKTITDKIDVEINAEVEKWINYFQGRGREHFERYMERSNRYMALMKKILTDNGVPEDLIYVAMIESGFSGKIKSRARAVGYWQFIGGTGKHYGLRSNKFIDERYDPVRSTEAAATYFKGLYNLFGDWFLAIASYNVGENRIKSLVMKNFTRSFWDLARQKKLPRETQEYIPKYLAASLIAREPEKYGFTGLDYKDPMVFDVIKGKEPIDMKVLAKSLSIDYDDLRDLNPAWKTQYILPLDGETRVRVPHGMGEKAQVALDEAIVKNKRLLASMIVPAKITFLRYKVKKGETIENIADRFDTSVDEILKVNRIRKGRIRPGLTIKIPSSAFKVGNESKGIGKARAKSRGLEGIIHTVRRGDTLSRIAKRYGVSESHLKKNNRLARNSKVLIGQRLAIH